MNVKKMGKHGNMILGIIKSVIEKEDIKQKKKQLLR